MAWGASLPVGRGCLGGQRRHSCQGPSPRACIAGREVARLVLGRVFFAVRGGESRLAYLSAPRASCPAAQLGSLPREMIVFMLSSTVKLCKQAGEFVLALRDEGPMIHDQKIDEIEMHWFEGNPLEVFFSEKARHLHRRNTKPRGFFFIKGRKIWKSVPDCLSLAYINHLTITFLRMLLWKQ